MCALSCRCRWTRLIRFAESFAQTNNETVYTLQVKVKIDVIYLESGREKESSLSFTFYYFFKIQSRDWNDLCGTWKIWWTTRVGRWAVCVSPGSEDGRAPLEVRRASWAEHFALDRSTVTKEITMTALDRLRLSSFFFFIVFNFQIKNVKKERGRRKIRNKQRRGVTKWRRFGPSRLSKEIGMTGRLIGSSFDRLLTDATGIEVVKKGKGK